MKKNIKIIWFDFDWTLVDNNWNPKTDIIELFNFIKSRWFLISIITWKWLYFIKDFLQKYWLNIDYIVSYDWANIYYVKENYSLKNYFIEKKIIYKILDF